MSFEQWLTNHQDAEMYSGPDGPTEVLGRVPQWSVFRQLEAKSGERIFVHYSGNNRVPAGECWIPAETLGPIDGPPPAGFVQPRWPDRPASVPLAPADPGRFSPHDGCAQYAQARRTDLGAPDGQTGAAQYLGKFSDRIVRVTRDVGDLREKVAPGYVLVWTSEHGWLNALGRKFGHVAIVESVAPDHVMVSHAGVGWRRQPTRYPTPSMFMRLNKDQLTDLYLIR